MAALNSVAIDLIPYSLRSIFQVAEISIFTQLVSGLLLSLLVLDYCQIISKCCQINIKNIYNTEERNKTPVSESEPSLAAGINRVAPHSFENNPDMADQTKGSPKISSIVKNDKIDQENKTLNQAATIERLLRNIAIENFCTSDLKPESKHSKKIVLLISNFQFLLKLSLMHLVLVGFSAAPTSGLILLIILELVYLAVYIFSYARNRHLKSVLSLLARSVQSVFLLLIEIMMLSSFLGLKAAHFSFSPPSQHAIVKIVLISNITEYAIFALNLLQMIIFST